MEKATAVRNPLIRAPQASDLTAPVGTLMRRTLTVETVDSLVRAAAVFRENGAAVLPVVDGERRLKGVLTDSGLAKALAEASEATDAVGEYIHRAETIAPYATAAEALRQGEDGQTRVVIDDAGRVVGLVSAVDLWPRRRVLPRPSAVGGMATPFGVYLTTGNVSAGAPWWGLMATGASMFGMIAAGWTLSGVLSTLRPETPSYVWLLVTAVVFFVLMRLLPLSGTHGAEHQVVHAIEREEPLTMDVVRRMPLVHPRCGTNLITGLGIFVALQSVKALEPYGGTMVALMVAMVFAMPLGSLVQRFITTRRPTEKQLAGAIRAGEDLLHRNAEAAYSSAKPLRRIWSMGLLQVMAGAYLVVGLVHVVKVVTKLPWIPDL